jgi:flagellar motor switch protein FliN/FliY
MSADPIEFTPLHEMVSPLRPPAAAELERLNDVTVEVSVEIGRTRMTLGDALALGPGSVIGLHRLAGEPVDLLVNGRVIARGEVVVLDEEFGLRVTDVAYRGLGPMTPEDEPVLDAVAEPVGFEPPAGVQAA